MIEIIQEDNPCGDDLKHEDEYIEIEIEIEKNFNISNTGETEWDVVIRKCENLLHHKTKDLKILSYWLYAQWRLHHWNNFFSVLKIYAEIIEKFNKELHPKVAKRKIKVLEWVENLLQDPLLKELETFSKEDLIDLVTILDSLEVQIPLMIEGEYHFLKETQKQSKRYIQTIEDTEKNREKQLELEREEELKRQEEHELLSKAEQSRRLEEEDILAKLSSLTADPVSKLNDLDHTDIDEMVSTTIALSKTLLEKAPGDYFSFKMLFSLGEVLINEALKNSSTVMDDFVPSNDIVQVVRKLEQEKVSVTQLNALIEQLLIRPTWMEGYYIVSKILYKLSRAQDATQLEESLFAFLYGNEAVLKISINNQSFISETMLSWLQTKSLSLHNNDTSVEYQQAYQEVLKIRKEENKENALGKLEEYYQKANSEEERFQWRLLFVDFALEIGDKKLALSLLKELDRLIDVYKINVWQPHLAITTYEMLLKPLFIQEFTPEGKERIYNKLSILDVQKVIKL